MNTPKELLSGYVEIYSLPGTFYRINDAINDQNVSMSEIGKMISEDVGLTVRLLRLVNSAFYNFPSRIETVSRAVTIVGTQQLHDLVLSTSVISLFKGIPSDLVSMDSFWRHGIACGVAARILAKTRREPNVERFFIGGMLHDIGRLIMYMKRTDQMRSLLQRCKISKELLHKAEKEMFGFDHAEVGFELVRAWNLPTSLQELVLHHHSPMAAKEYQIETALIHVADVITHSLQLGSSGETFVPPLSEQSWDFLGISASNLKSIAEQMEDQMNVALQAMFGGNGHG